MGGDYSPTALATAAGTDPWALARKVTTEVWDVGASGRRTRGLLSENGDDMEDVGRAVTIVADELASTSSNVEKELTTLTDQVNGVIARRNAFFTAAGSLAPQDRSAAEQGFLDEAVGLVRGCARRVQGDLDAYVRVLTSRTGFLADLGYEAATDEDAVLGPQILRTPPGARLEGGLEPGVPVTVPAPGGGLVVGTPPAPDLGSGPPDGGAFPFPIPDGSRVHATAETGGTGETGSPDGTPAIDEGQQGKHQEGHPNFDPKRSTLTGDPDELIQQAGSGDQVGAVPVGEPGSRERVDFGKEIGVYRDLAGNTTPTTVGIIHYSKRGAHIVPARPR